MPTRRPKLGKRREELIREAHAARKGKGVDPAERKREERNAISFEQLAKEYMEKASAGVILGRKGKPKKPGTVTIDKYRIAHLVGYFGSKLVKNIDRGDCQRCLEKLIIGKHGAARTYGLLGGLFTYAIEQGYIVSNPAHGIRKPADGRRRVPLGCRRATAALGKDVEAAEARARAAWQAVVAIRLFALTGCRKGGDPEASAVGSGFSGPLSSVGQQKTGQTPGP